MGDKVFFALAFYVSPQIESMITGAHVERLKMGRERQFVATGVMVI